MGQQPRACQEARAVTARVRRNPWRADRAGQNVLLRRLPGVHPRLPFDATTTVAPESWRRGDFSGCGRGLVDPARANHSPGTSRSGGAGSAPSRKRYSAKPDYIRCQIARGDSNNLVDVTSDKSRTHQGDAKVDANLTDKDRLIFRMSDQKYEAAARTSGAGKQLRRQPGDAPFWARRATGIVRWASPPERAAPWLTRREFRGPPGIGPASATRTRPSGYRVGRPSPA